MSIPKEHPRAESLRQRQLLEAGLKKGIVAPAGMIAFGRGEAFDYLIGEKTTSPAQKAARAAAALLLLSKNPVLSVNGNVCMLCPKETIELAKIIGCEIEANIFYPPQTRRELIAAHFEKLGKKILGAKPNKKISKNTSKRMLVDQKGIWSADTVLVALEDGDRTEILKKNWKNVIAIDLNPKSRTAKKADITLVDNVVRAIPEISMQAKKLKKEKKETLEKIVKSFDNKKNLQESLEIIKQGA